MQIRKITLMKKFKKIVFLKKSKLFDKLNLIFSIDL